MAVERFYIIKDGRRDGPFDEPYVRFLLENDEVGFEDFCETGDGERFRLGTMYEPVEAEARLGDEQHQGGGKQEDGRQPRARSGRVLYLGHPSFLRYPISWFLAVAGAAGGYLLGPHSLWAMLGGFGLASAATIYIVLDRSSHLYVITPRRIEAVHGLLAKDSMEIRVEDLRTINVRRSGLVGLFGVGTIEFSSAGDVIDVSFADIWGARRVKNLVRRLQDEMDD